jgi:hypothetical protein
MAGRAVTAPARAVALVCLVATAAQAAPLATRLTFTRCVAVVDEPELRELLRIELGRDITLDGGAGAMQLAVSCAADAGQVTLSVGAHSDTLSLADVPGRMRARTLALALAERLRRALQDAALETAPGPPPTSTPTRTPEPVKPAPIPPAVTPALIAPPAPPPANRKRLYGGLAVGLFSFSLAGFAIGSPLTAIEPTNPDRAPVRITGGVFVAVSAAAFITSAVTFGLWLRERKRSRPTARQPGHTVGPYPTDVR